MGINSFEKLTSFCKENNIELINDYSMLKINLKSQIEGKCILNNECKNTFKKTLFSLLKYGAYCKNCVNIIRYDKIKKSCLIKYGCENIFSNDDIKQKINNTNMQKYGKTSYLASDKGKENYKKIIKDKYGVENISQLVTIKNKKIETSLKNYGYEYPSQSNIIREKIIQTNNINFGCNYGFQNEIIKNKIKDTCLIKYGVEYIGQNKDIKQKIKNINKNKYGVENPLQNEDIKNKTIDTCLIKYGVKNPMQNSKIAEKAANNSYQTKIYTFPSGNKIKYQGYENFALDELINSKIEENDIFNKKIDVPEIWYFDENNIKRRHYVDIYIKSLNKCIEVKSHWYFNKSKNIIFKKQNAAKQLGYNYEIWVYDNKRNKLIYDDEVKYI